MAKIGGFKIRKKIADFLNENIPSINFYADYATDNLYANGIRVSNCKVIEDDLNAFSTDEKGIIDDIKHSLVVKKMLTKKS